ncbi:MAG: hypothetical protein N2C14_17345 [Planctomycetales bacterium]
MIVAACVEPRNIPLSVPVRTTRSAWLAALMWGAMLFFLAPQGAASGEEIRHSFLATGPVFTGIIGEDGKTAWDAGRKGSRDGFVLPNGNILITWANEVKELTPEKKVVFHYAKSPENQELSTAQRLKNGNTLITELGAMPRLLEVAPDGKIAVEFALKPETNNAHLQTRMARKLKSGNYLAPHLLAFKVKEYTPKGEVVQEIRTDLEELGGRKIRNWPFTAIRLANGNTVIGCTLGHKVIETDPQGKVVWSVSNDDLEGKPIDDACGVQRLPNGNTVITSHHARKGVKLLEVTRDKKIVWTYEGPHRIHHFQILTTNGKPLEGEPLK